MSRLDRIVGWSDIRNAGFRGLWKPLVAELIGTELLVITAVGCGIFSSPAHKEVVASLGAAFAVAVLLETFIPISGGHINPAVTLSLVAAGKMPLLRASLYVLHQLLGASIGAGILYFNSVDNQFDKSITLVNPQVGHMHAVTLECLITFVFVLVIFAVLDENRDPPKTSPAFLISLTIAIGHFFALNATGASMNPARSFGPSIIKWIWTDHWVYWLGPVSGGMSAAFMYNWVFAAPPKDGTTQQQDATNSTKRNTAESGC